MRILFLINFFQVPGSGGEDLSCQQVISGLKERGHTTLVLTSMHGTNNVPVEADGISRSLFLEMDLAPWRDSITFFTSRKTREKQNIKTFKRVVEEFEPDVIFIWGIWNLHRSLPAFAEARYPDKVVYRFGTYWPTLPSQHEVYWRTRGRKWYSRVLKNGLSHIALAILAREEQRMPLTFKHAICVSAATKNILVEAGIPVQNARVIYTGLDPQKYGTRKEDYPPDHKNQNLNLLYAGRLYPEKGVDTAINAVEKLVFDQGLRNLKLTVAGSGSADYEQSLRHLVDKAGLSDHVSFSGHVPAEEMPQFLQKFDVLVVPSLWQEPFSRIVLEGMISGLVVIATTSGGTTEVLVDGENGLLFAPGNAEDLAQRIHCLVIDPELRWRLAISGQHTVVKGFTQTKMMHEIEGYLQEVVQASAQQQTNPLERRTEAAIPECLPTVSIIIPSYNRVDMLRDSLNSIAQQTYPKDKFEVIVVDDGSTDGTKDIVEEKFPFTLRYFRQNNQGVIIARNLAARNSSADILVFLDDDIILEPDYLTYLMREHAASQNGIVVGTVNIRCDGATPLCPDLDTLFSSTQNTVDLAFTDVSGNNMSIRRSGLFEVGMFQDLGFQGSGPWCDVDIAYRAYLQGFDFRRSTKAKCWHRDYFANNLDRYKKRVKTSAFQAVLLFQKYSDLRSHLPMFNDKTPVTLGQDPPRLIARKLARSMISSGPVLWSMEKIVNVLEKSNPASTMLPALYHYITGGYIFRGYREGLRKYEMMGAQE